MNASVDFTRFYETRFVACCYGSGILWVWRHAGSLRVDSGVVFTSVSVRLSAKEGPLPPSPY